jgi:glycosyltransferase involved in cell wall biosynthesis
MRIAQVAPLYESVPPRMYGGTERIVSYLTEALVDLGHDVSLYASGDSVTGARLRPCCERALRLDKRSVDPIAHHVCMAEVVFQEAGDYDIVHSHIDYLAFPLLRRLSTTHLTTLHGRLDLPDLRNLFREFREEPLVSISDSQRTPLAWANWLSTVYHGLPENLYQGVEQEGKYLAFLGRVSPEKGLPRAIEIACRAGLPLKVAAKVDKVDRDYFDEVIRPALRWGDIEFVGEIGEADKNEFLGGALALLFPIDWPEPFGIVMIEAMACGTPVIAYPRGSVREVIEDGKTGYIVRDVHEAVDAVKRITKLSRRTCRDEFERRFTAERMARDYLAAYRKAVFAGAKAVGSSAIAV